MKRILMALAIVCILAVCAVGVIAPQVSRYLVAPPSHWPGGKFALFEVKEGATATGVADELASKGLIRSAWQFKRILRSLGAESKLRPGMYRVEPGTDATKLAHQLADHDIWAIKVTIPEGLTLKQIAERIEKAGQVENGQWLPKAQDIIAQATAANLRKATGLSIPTASAEGYLFPATYGFRAGESADEIVDTMFREFFSRFVTRYDAELKRRRLSAHQLVTLASIVEREAEKDTERPLIAQVFLNRLAKGMRLQSCATVQYVLPKHKTRLLFEDLKIASPYNTYRNAGLPPGPICCPGDASLRAAVFPQATDALYFVARGDGTHIFSRTWAEHQAAIAKLRGQAGGNALVEQANPQPDRAQPAGR
jgi:UPF0755 protein